MNTPGDERDDMNWLWSLMAKVPPIPEHNRSGPWFAGLAVTSFVFARWEFQDGDWVAFASLTFYLGARQERQMIRNCSCIDRLGHAHPSCITCGGNGVPRNETPPWVLDRIRQIEDERPWLAPGSIKLDNQWGER